MGWYYWIAMALILLQLLLSIQVFNNCRYVLSKYRKKRQYWPRTVLIVPCKGLDANFRENITSFFKQDYGDYLLWFVVADKSDPAYDELLKLKDELTPISKARDVKVLVAGQVQPQLKPTQNRKTQVPSCSQKIHNLLYGYNQIGDDIDNMAFADSDICVRSDWLSQIIWPLRQYKNGAASGYRWFVPQKNNLAALALSALNAKVAQFLGNTRFNHAWGGSMAIRVDVFRRVGLDKIWLRSISDDFSLSYAVKNAGLKVAFVPACLVASYESTTWAKLFEFARRQFIITRINAAGTWWFALSACLFSTLGLWGGSALAVYTAAVSDKHLPLFIAVPIVFFAAQLIRAVLRQMTISRLLRKELPKMKAAMAADILFFWIWSLLLLAIIVSSAFSRTITWRQIRYKLLSPTETIVIGPPK